MIQDRRLPGFMRASGWAAPSCTWRPLGDAASALFRDPALRRAVDAHVTRSYGETIALVEADRDMIGRVADALLRHRFLMGDEIDRLRTIADSDGRRAMNRHDAFDAHVEVLLRLRRRASGVVYARALDAARVAVAKVILGEAERIAGVGQSKPGGTDRKPVQQELRGHDL